MRTATPKRIIIRSDDKPRGPRVNIKQAFRAQKALGHDIVMALVHHMKRKGITGQAFAEKCKWSLPRLQQTVRRSHKLDLRTIALWESILGEDLIVSSRSPRVTTAARERW